MATKKKLTHDDYTVGWATVLPVEVTAARLLLDEEHVRLPSQGKDDNSYILGRMGLHNIVITFPGVGIYGTNAAAQMVTNMVRTFPNIRFGLLVGVGGGAPGPGPKYNETNRDIRLGDVVVSKPEGDKGGVFQYDMGKQLNEEYQILSHLNSPPNLLLGAVKLLISDRDVGEEQMNEYIKDAVKSAAERRVPQPVLFHSPGQENDKLFKASFRHAGGDDCSSCSTRMAIDRPPRGFVQPLVHYGTIASSNTVMKSAENRDKLREKWKVACFEMEAAGLMNNFPCLVIRGVCDYSDDHKNKAWQPYAAVTAAAYAKDLLRVINPEDVAREERPAAKITNSNSNSGEASTSEPPANTSSGTSSRQDQASSPSTPPRPQVAPTPLTPTTPTPRTAKTQSAWPPAGLQAMPRDEMKAKWADTIGQHAQAFIAPDDTEVTVLRGKTLCLSYNHVLYPLYYCRQRDKGCPRKEVRQWEWRLEDKRLLPTGLREKVSHVFICDTRYERIRYILEPDYD
ncbi:hypothetical protein TWF730_006720 [Orbilia blumenaviensis]|uniref:Nucleoside phosphorylase domain-containing protein n=1 Tax=Orbilia blumenaviensis TaxID=1796055 RepID=A0AAV9VHF5_9PEZI